MRSAFGFIATWVALGLFLLAGVVHSAGQAHAQANDLVVAAQLQELVGDLDDTDATRSLIADLLIICSPEEDMGRQDLLGQASNCAVCVAAAFAACATCAVPILSVTVNWQWVPFLVQADQFFEPSFSSSLFARAPPVSV
ncbi:MAG: hypothetical protein KUG61_08360 [Parvibaculaceae bacterium]|nr:hypothetical protein [Parvibaculaceae bacterium]